MINVSREFLDTMRIRTDFKQYADITLADGTVLNLSASDFTIANNYINDGAGASQIPLGVAVEKNIQIELMNDHEQYSTYDFYGAVIELYLTFKLSETVEKVAYGKFTVINPETYGETVITTAVDDMYKADKPYSTSLTFPATTGAMLQEICEKCDLPLGTTAFTNSDFVVETAPDASYTFRSVIGFIAMIAGGNARINRLGYLEIISYDFTMMERLRMYDGGTFNPWENTVTIDGGTFNPWSAGDVADGGLFSDYQQVQILHDWKNIKIDTDDIVITGIKAIYSDEDGNELEVLEGEEGYVLEVENPLIAGKESAAVALIGAIMIGGRYRKFEGDHISYPIAEFMDPVLVTDRRNNLYQSIITDVNFAFFGLTTIKNSSESAVRNSSRYVSEAVRTYIAARQLVTRERTERQKAIDQLAYQLANSSGLFMTKEAQDDGSCIYYMHDKPTVKESMIIWKLTANALGISTDGGVTYPYGLDVSGMAILNRIYAIGLDANYINTGAITIEDDNGNVLFSADIDTKKVTISGASVDVGGKSATQAISDAVTESKEYSDEKLADYADAVTANIDNLQAQIDGQVETYYYDYEPTLQNVPASEWTTTAERQKHIGDIFYWKSKGYAYRFLLDGSTWKWQLVQDTDITQAIAKAEEAQDTADAKRRVFVVQPVPPYDIGDLWTQGSSGDILTCSTARSSGSYVASDWQKLNKYTDDTKALEALGKFNFEEVFNLLTKNGEIKGIFLENGQLYISFTYAKGGELTLGGANNGYGVLKILSASGAEIGKWDKDGINATGTFTSEGMNPYNYNTRGAILKDGTLTIEEAGKVETKFSLVKIADDIFGTGIGTTLQELALGILTDDGNTFNPYYILNNGSNRNGFTERHIFNGDSRFLNGAKMINIYLMPSNASTDQSKWVRLYEAVYDGSPSLMSSGGFYAYGSIGCSGTKYRVVDTEHYGKVGMNAFETAEAYFSDLGSNMIGEDGTCRIDFDPVFMESIETGQPYKVQLTQTSEKETKWIEKKENYFVIHGEPGATFDWMLMCKQKGYADVRMQEIFLKTEVNDNE